MPQTIPFHELCLSERRDAIDMMSVAELIALADNLHLPGDMPWANMYTWKHIAQVLAIRAEEYRFKFDGEANTPDQCCECDQQSVGYSEGLPWCAAHYQARPSLIYPANQAMERPATREEMAGLEGSPSMNGNILRETR